MINWNFRGMVVSFREAGKGSVVEMVCDDTTVEFYTTGPVPTEGETILAGGTARKTGRYVSVIGSWVQADSNAKHFNVYTAWGECTPTRDGVEMLLGPNGGQSVEIPLDPMSAVPRRGESCTIYGEMMMVTSGDKDIMAFGDGFLAAGCGAKAREKSAKPVSKHAEKPVSKPAGKPAKRSGKKEDAEQTDEQ